MNFDIHGIKVKSDKSYFFPDHFKTEKDFSPDLTIDRFSYKNFNKDGYEKLGLQYWGGNNKVYFQSGSIYKNLQKILISDLFSRTTFSFRSYNERHGIENIIKLLFQIKLLQKNCTLVHAAGLEKDGRGIIMSGWPRTGKSSSALRLAQRKEYNILGDDMVIISANGRIYSFPKRVGVFYKNNYHLDLTDSERRKLFLKYAAVKITPPKFLRLDRSLRLELGRFSDITEGADLKEVYVVRKTKGELKAELEESVAVDKALTHVLNIFYHRPFAKRIFFAYCLLNNENPLYFEEKTKEIIKDAFEGKQCYLLRNREGNFEGAF